MDKNISEINLELISEDKELYSLKFSEGNPNLKKLLIYAWDNNIKVIDCKSGIGLNPKAYIAFQFDSIAKYLPYIINSITKTNLNFRIGFNLGNNDDGKIIRISLKDLKDTDKLFIELGEILKEPKENNFNNKTFIEINEIMNIIEDRNLGFYPNKNYSDILQIQYQNLDKEFILMTNIDYIINYLDNEKVKLVINHDLRIPIKGYVVSYGELNKVRELIITHRL